MNKTEKGEKERQDETAYERGLVEVSTNAMPTKAWGTEEALGFDKRINCSPDH